MDLREHMRSILPTILIFRNIVALAIVVMGVTSITRFEPCKAIAITAC